MSHQVTQATRQLFSGTEKHVENLRSKFYRPQQKRDWLEEESSDEEGVGVAGGASVKQGGTHGDTHTGTEGQADDEMDPLDRFMQDLTQATEAAQSTQGLKRRGDPASDLSDNEDDGLIEHLQKRRKAQEDDNPVEADLRQMMQSIINARPPEEKRHPTHHTRPTHPTHQDETDEEDESPVAHASIPANFDWDAMMSQRARASTLSEIPKSCYQESPHVSQLSVDDIAQYRKDFRIVTSGLNVPRPLMDYSHLIASFRAQFEPVEFGLIALLEQKHKSRVAPDAFESQYLPCALSGRNVMVTLPPPSDDKSVMSVGTGDGSVESICSTLLLHAYSVVARFLIQRLNESQSQWLRRPLILFVTSTDQGAIQLSRVLKTIDSRLGVFSDKKPRITHIAHNDDASDIVVGSAKSLVAAFAADDLSLEDIHLIIFCDLGGGLRFEEELGRVLIAQARDDCQKVVMSSVLDPQVDAFVRQYTQRPIRIGIETEDQGLKDTRQVEYRFLSIPDAENRYKWMASSLPKFKPYGNVLVFCNDDKRVADLTALLMTVDPDIRALYVGDGMDGERVQALRQVPILITTVDAALKLLRLKYYAAVVNYDCPISAYEYGRRAIFADPVGLTTMKDSKARVYTLLPTQHKTAAYIADSFVRKFGRKNVPHTLDELALKYAPFREAMLQCETLPPERPSVQKGNYMKASVHQEIPKPPATKPGLPMQFIKAPLEPTGPLKVSVSAPRPLKQIGPAPPVINSSSDSESSDSDSNPTKRPRPQAQSSILDTARLRARREANLAKYKASKLAEQMRNKKESLSAEEEAQLNTNLKLAQVSQIAASILAKRT